jgi:hypothetical protein
MTRLVQQNPCHTIEQANTTLALLLDHTYRALRGEADFGVEDVHHLLVALEQMTPILDQSPELRRSQPEVAAQLDRYKSQLTVLQVSIHNIRVALLARQASLRAGQSQNLAVSQWLKAFCQTR